MPHFKKQISGLLLVPSEGGRFEISVDDELIYSKLKTGRFPDHADILREIEARASRGGGG